MIKSILYRTIFIKNVYATAYLHHIRGDGAFVSLPGQSDSAEESIHILI